MAPSVKTMMPTTIDPSAPAAAAAGPSNSKINLREFVADDDAANFGSTLWKTIDQSAFVMAQREALEAFNFAKALRLSEETAAQEAQRRQVEVASAAPALTSQASSSAAATTTIAHAPPANVRTEFQASFSSAGSSSAAQFQPIMVRKHSRRPSSSNDVAVASAASIPRSLAMDGVQPVLLENKPSSSPPSSSSFSPAIHHPIKSSASSSPPSSYSKASSASASAASSSSSSRITKQPSQNLSLSTSSSSSSSSVPAIQVQVVDSHHHIASSSSNYSSPAQHSHSQSQSHLHSHSQSRASSHSNAIPASSASSSSHSHRIEQRSFSKREPSPPSSSSYSSSLFVSQSQSHSSFSAPASSSRTHPSSQSDMTTSTKRRRTAERQPSSVFPATSSSSPNPTHNNTNTTIVAPPISEPKKSSSSASARDVLLGQIMNPATATAKEVNITTPASTLAQEQAQPRLRRRSTHPTSERDLDLFTATRNCVRCGNLVVSPRSQPSFTHDPFSLPFSDLLHVTCSACGTNHCRGCFSVVRCPRHCSGGEKSCAVRNCCSDIRAIAIFEALSSFDYVYAAEAGFFGIAGKGKGNDKSAGGKQRAEREEYLKQVIGNSKAAQADKDKSKSMRRFEDAFVRTLRILCSWLQPPSPSPAPPYPSSLEEEVDEKGVKKPSPPSPSSLIHPSISLLFANSYLPEVMHLFLSNTNVRDWVAHSETYICLLTLLRRMFDLAPSLSPVLMQPLQQIRYSSGLAEVVWNQGSIEWEVEVDQGKGRELVRTRSGTSISTSLRPSLNEVVKALERDTRPGLRALAGRLQFAGTVEKVESLCDGISYLLLQQVVGGI